MELHRLWLSKDMLVCFKGLFILLHFSGELVFDCFDRWHFNSIRFEKISKGYKPRFIDSFFIDFLICQDRSFLSLLATEAIFIHTNEFT